MNNDNITLNHHEKQSLFDPMPFLINIDTLKSTMLMGANRGKALNICGFSAVFLILEYGVFLYHSFCETA